MYADLTKLELFDELKRYSCTGRKWSATESVSQAESTLKHRDIVGITAVGRQGIGETKTVLWSRSDQKKRRAMIQSEGGQRNMLDKWKWERRGRGPHGTPQTGS